MKQGFRKLLMGIAVLLSCQPIAGCGLKADPVPVPGGTAATIGTVSTLLTDGRVGLRWSVQGPVAEADLFKIYRADPPTCQGCPREYRLLTEAMRTDSRLVRENGPVFLYVDRDADKDKAYSYRVAVCDRVGRCSSPSAEAQAPQGR